MENDINPPKTVTPVPPVAPPPAKPTTPSVPPSPRPESNKMTVVLVIILALIMGGIGVLGYRYESQSGKSKPDVIKMPGTYQGLATPQATPTSTPTPIAIQTGLVDWLPAPQPVASVGFFAQLDSFYPYNVDYCQSGSNCTNMLHTTDTYEPKATYYRVGTMKTKYAGAPVYLAIVRGLLTTHVFKGIGTEKDFAHDYSTLALFIKTGDNTFVLPNDYGNSGFVCRDNCTIDTFQPNPKAGISFDKDLSLDVVGSKSEFDDTQTGLKIFVTRTNNMFSPSTLFLIKDFANGYALYSNEDIHNNPIKLKTILNTTFTMRLPTGLAGDVNGDPYNDGFIYKKDPNPEAYSPFSDAAQITWTTGDPPALLPPPVSTPSGSMMTLKGVSYTTDYDGCWGTMLIDGISSDSEFLDVHNNLTAVATTDKGDTLYDINAKDFKIFQEFWLYKVSIPGTFNLSYDDYLKLKPILVWKNKLGVYRMIFRSELVLTKCWAEPLIYLYPTQPTRVTVGLDKTITLKESEPPYGDGWTVTAYPDGSIYSSIKDRYYSSLYWEGNAPAPNQPAISNVVTQRDIHTYFVSALTKFGLNEKERKDFENYWEPKVTGSPYYLISFYDTNALNRVAPLHINPVPDTEIRVLMEYTRLTRPIAVDSLGSEFYKTPKRIGFTAVEWGGILHK